MTHRSFLEADKKRRETEEQAEAERKAKDSEERPRKAEEKAEAERKAKEENKQFVS